MWVDNKYYTQEDIDRLAEKYPTALKPQGGYRIIIDTGASSCVVKKPNGVIINQADVDAFIRYEEDKISIKVEIKRSGGL